MRTSKAIAGALGAGVGASIGDSVAELVLWSLMRVPGLADIPQGAVSAIIVAAVTAFAVYFAPPNQVNEDKTVALRA